MVKVLTKVSFKQFYKVNEYVAHTSPMYTHYHSENPLEKWLWQKKKKVISNLLRKIDTKNVIDFGCGDGGLIELFDNNTNYTGIDISPTQVKLARAQIKKIGKKNAKVYMSDATTTKFENNTFDAALVCDIVEHVISPKELFSEIKRVVKKDGYIIFSIPNEIWLQLARAMLLRFPLRSPDHINAVFPKDIKENFPKILKNHHIPFEYSFYLSLVNIYLVKNAK